MAEAAERETWSTADVKYLKWVVLILLLVVIVAMVVQSRRDAIALEIANRVLRDTDFVVRSISVRTLGVDHIELAAIELETPTGTRYDLAGLYFPLNIKGGGARNVTIERLEMSWPDGQPQDTSYADLARTALLLPETLPNTNVRVQRMAIQGVPELSGISWTTSGPDQSFAAEIGGLALDVAARRSSDIGHQVRIAAADGAGTQALLGNLAVTDGDNQLRADGDLHVELVLLEPLLRSLEWVPAAVQGMDARIAGAIAVEFHDENNPVARLQPTLPKGSSMSLRSEDGARIGIALERDMRFDLVLEYPSLAWTVDAAQVSGTVRLEDGTRLATTLSDVQCRAGTECRLRATASAGPGVWGGMPAKAVRVTTTSDATIAVTEHGWSAAVREVRVNVDELRPAKDLLATLDVALSNLETADGLASFTAQFRTTPGSGRLRYKDLELAVPGAEGRIDIAGDALRSSLRVFDKVRSLAANVELEHDLARATGRARLRDGMIDFGRRKLSQRVVGWSQPWDAIAGTWSFAGELDWTTTPTATGFRGRSTQRIEGLAGIYNDIGMAGLATTLEVDIDSGTDLSIRPASLTIDLIDVGLPITDVAAQVSLDPANLAARVDALTGAALGGQFAVDPFTYSAGAERTDLQLHLNGVQLQFMVDLAQFEKLKITGTVSGMLPVALTGTAVRVDSGLLASDPPGGVIRYRGSAPAAGANPQLSMVTGALSNFVYESLTARVNYTEAGDLTLGMRLKGINPDRDPTQPIILNLTVDDNIPQLLKSLQAVRSIEDILERKAAK